MSAVANGRSILKNLRERDTVAFHPSANTSQYFFFLRTSVTEISRMPIVRCNREMHVSAEPETGRCAPRAGAFLVSIVLRYANSCKGWWTIFLARSTSAWIVRGYRSTSNFRWLSICMHQATVDRSAPRRSCPNKRDNDRARMARFIYFVYHINI